MEIGVTKFLSGEDIAKEIGKLVKGKTAKIAVAYWGKGSANWLIDTAKVKMKGTKIICDLWSGFCDPKEIETLMEDAEVYHLDDLHTKLWIAGPSMVMGSANASNAGMWFSKSTKRKVEASLLVSDRSLVNEANKWFDKVLITDANKILPAELDEVKPLWESRQETNKRLDAVQRRKSERSLLEALRRGEEKAIQTIEKVKIIAYPEVDLPYDGIEDQYYARQKIFYSERHLATESEDDWFYHDSGKWNLSPGEIFLDFEISKNGKRFGPGVFTRVSGSFRDKRNQWNLIPYKELPSLNGYTLSKKDQKFLETRLRKRFNEASGKALTKDGSFEEKLPKFLEDIIDVSRQPRSRAPARRR